MERYLPACHGSVASGTQPHIGHFYPKNCRQLREWSCPEALLQYLPQGIGNCLHHIWFVPELKCYTYKDLPPEQQLSDSPATNDTRVAWYTTKEPEHTPEPMTPQEVAKIQDLGEGFIWHPHDECPERCNERGYCVTHAARTDVTTPWCRCVSTWEGNNCTIPRNTECFRNCSGVGTCIDGWCHCQPGYWGPGCTRNKAYNSSVGHLPNPATLRIYVYTLPTHVVHRFPFSDDWFWGDPMYDVELPLTEALLGDQTVFTQNPWEANLFYVPGYVRWFAGNTGSPVPIMTHLSTWLRHHSLLWNTTDGRNHVWHADGDRGGCDVYGRPLHIQKPIMLVHFGQAMRHPYARVPYSQHYDAANQPGCKEAAGQGGALLLPHHDEGHHHTWKGAPVNLTKEDIMVESMPCYRPEKDVVIPSTAHQTTVMYARTLTYAYITHANGTIEPIRRNETSQRNATFFFAGGSSPDMSYSQGVRQTVLAMFGKGGAYDPDGPNARPDFHIPRERIFQVDAMRLAKFCLAPTGYGWGVRLTEVLMCGCVPVIIQDHTYQPLWDVLPYHEFSLRIARRDLHLLVELLDAVTPQELEALQRGVDRWHRAFLWSYFEMEPGVPLAYNYTIEALYRRVLSLDSEMYRHRARTRHMRQLR